MLFMKDFVKKYQKNKLFSNVNIVLASLVLAFWINVFVINWTDIGSKLKTSVLNSTETKEIKSNIYIQKIENEYFVISDKSINDARSLSLSFTYNPENVEISSFDSSYWDVTNLSSTPWISSLIITWENNISLWKWDKLLKIDIIKKEDKSENLNILNANFIDTSNDHYELSTSWITF